MVLQELGVKLNAALKKIQTSTVVDEELLKATMGDICRALLESDVNVKMVMQLRKNVEKCAHGYSQAGPHPLLHPNQHVCRHRQIQRAVMGELVTMLDPKTKTYQMKKGRSNVVMFVGLQGAGKTTTIAKFAHYYQRKGWKVAMVCADTFRAGAFDQLKQNATKLRCPFYGSYTEADPVQIAEEGVEQFRKEKYEVIIVDTSGRHMQEEALFEEMQEIQAAVLPDSVVFVMDATQGQAVGDQAKAFHQAVDVGSVIVTKLDGHAKGGGALSAVASTGSPIVFLGSGEHFDDLELFDAQSFVGKLMGFGDIRGLMRELHESVDPKEMMERLGRGQFVLRDMYQQFQSVLKLGPMNKVMSMLPNVPPHIAEMGRGQQGQQMLKRFMYIMDSMSDKELDGKVDIASSPKRIQRIARGSGCLEGEVIALLKNHEKLEKVDMMKGGKGGMPSMQQMKQLQKNPRAMQQQMQQM
ncbi:unnamed protein product, partial [Chrysoparadoxa australica]